MVDDNHGPKAFHLFDMGQAQGTNDTVVLVELLKTFNH